MKTALIAVDVVSNVATSEIKTSLLKIAEEVDLVVVTRDSRTARPPTSFKKLADYIVTRDEGSFSAFVGGVLRPKLTLLQILTHHDIRRVIIGGLGPAIVWTALDAAASGYLTIVGLDIIAIPDEEQALENWRRAGVTVQNVA